MSALFFVLLPPIRWWHAEGYNRFTVFMDGVEVGKVSDPAHAEKLYRDVRKEYAAGVAGISLAAIPKFTYQGEEMIVGEVDADETIRTRMLEKLQQEKQALETEKAELKKQKEKQAKELARKDCA